MKRIDTMFAFIVEDDTDDTEGVPAFTAPGMGVQLPMVGADEARIASLRPIAQQFATSSGKVVRIFRFRTRELLEEIQP